MNKLSIFFGLFSLFGIGIIVQSHEVEFLTMPSKNELNQIKKCSKLADSLNLQVHAGHGMDYKTTKILSKIKEIKEFNIGHFIIGESIFFGLKKVIKKFKKISKSK